MMRTVLHGIEEISRRGDFLVASVLIVVSVYLWILGRESGLLRSLRYAVSEHHDRH